MEHKRTEKIWTLREQALPPTEQQIASLASHHFVIRKHEEDGRASTKVCSLDRDGRVEELARILGGLSVTDAQRQAALDMLDGE